MNKKLTIFSIVLIITGIIGTIGFSISSVPYFVDTVSEIEQEVSKESVIFNKEVKIDKLNINIEDTDVIIKRHNNNNVLITQTGNKESFSYKIENVGNELSIIQDANKVNSNYKSIKDLKQLTDYLAENMYSNSIVIHLPNNVNISASSNDGTIRVEENVLLDDITFKTQSGQIALPKNIKQVNKLDIKSTGQIRLSALELLGIKEVNISANLIDLYSHDEDIFIDDIENYIPNTLNISNTQDYNLGIYIDSETPIANDLNINAYEDNVYLDFPIENFNVNLNLKASENIFLYELVNKGLINENQYGQYDNIRELSKELRNDFSQDAKEYNINIKARTIEID